MGGNDEIKKTTLAELDLLSLNDLESGMFSSELFWTGTFNDYLKIALNHPLTAESSHQRLYRSIITHGTEKTSWLGKETIRYKAFDDPIENGKDAIFGLEFSLEKFVTSLRAAAERRGQERRFFLFHGPVGSSKSTLTRLLKKLLSSFTKTADGQIYSFSWVVKPDDIEGHQILGLIDEASGHKASCPIHEDPFMILPEDVRKKVETALNESVKKLHSDKNGDFPEDKRIEFEGEACPFCRQVFSQLLAREKGNWKAVLEKHVEAKRIVFSEEDRVGIGSFRPKDEKNQDSTELSGDINYRKIAQIGSESDPRAFNFDGEFQVAHRGMIYMEEQLKLEKAFQYDLLGLTQEHEVKPKRCRHMHIDTVIIGSTNNPEFEKLRDDNTMEAFLDRMTRVDVPYVLRISEEMKIYTRTYNRPYSKKHILSPHTIYVASLFAVLSRLKKPENAGFNILAKAKLFDGLQLQDITQAKIRELADASRNEGMDVAVSPRYIQDMIAAARVNHLEAPCVTPFAVFETLTKGLENNSLLKGKTKQEEIVALLQIARNELNNIITKEFRQVIGGDKRALTDLWENYLSNIEAYVNKGTIYNELTGSHEKPNERLMREIESQVDIGEREKDEFRSGILRSIGSLATKGKIFDWKSDTKIIEMLEKKLFNDRKDWINLSKLNTGSMSQEDKTKFDQIKEILVTEYGYCHYCASIMMSYAASIFNDGSSKKP